MPDTEQSRTALLVMDVQQGIVEMVADQADSLLERLRVAIDAAHRHGIPVIYVTVGFRHGYPEVSRRNRNFSATKAAGRFGVDDPLAVVHPAVAPQPDDVVVTKLRVSAFTGSDLSVVLRSGEIETLVLTGIATGGVVLSTVREAADLDFRLVVLADGCADMDEEVHRVLLEKVISRQADVISVDAWTAQLAE